MDFILLCLLAIGWLVQAATAGTIAEHRGASAFGYLLAGLLLGPFALLLAYDVGGQDCVFCKSWIHREASRCPRCQAILWEPKTSPLEQKSTAPAPPANAKVCDQCGGWAKSGATMCPSCGVTV